MSGYDKFSDRFRKNAALGVTPAKAAKAAKVEPTGWADETHTRSFSNFSTLAGGAPSPDLSAPADVIAPQELAGVPQSKDEPPLNEPYPARRGRVERRRGAFLHFCVTCGAWGAFGYGVTGDRAGLWYCLPHRPQMEKRRTP